MTVETVLASLAGRPFPLVRQSQSCAEQAAVQVRDEAFPGAVSPVGARAGLLLRLGCWDDSHLVAQDLSTAEGSYWHAIVHRMEPDAGNARYWSAQVGRHATFAALQAQAQQILARHELPPAWRLPSAWDANWWIDRCEEARRLSPETIQHAAALAIHDAEWRLLFEYCRASR